VHIRIPPDYDIDQFATRLQREAVVHVCSRDFLCEMIRLPSGRLPLARGRRLFVVARTAEELFPAGGITGFNETV
jgi:hypothetical protein